MNDMIGTYVVPVMKAEKFSKVGQRFRLSSDRGDVAILEFSTHQLERNEVVFDVICWISPMPYWDWLHRNEPRLKKPDSSGALVTFWAIPPAGLAYAPNEGMPFRSRWAFSGIDGFDACGRELARVLRDEVVPRMVSLLNRRKLLDEVRRPSCGIVRLRDLGMCEIALRVDEEGGEDMDKLLVKAEAEGTFAPFVAWARDRLNSRLGRG